MLHTAAVVIRALSRFTFTLILLLCLPFGKRSLALVTLKIGLHIGE